MVPFDGIEGVACLELFAMETGTLLVAAKWKSGIVMGREWP